MNKKELILLDKSRTIKRKTQIVEKVYEEKYGEGLREIKQFKKIGPIRYLKAGFRDAPDTTIKIWNFMFRYRRILGKIETISVAGFGYVLYARNWSVRIGFRPKGYKGIGKWIFWSKEARIV